MKQPLAGPLREVFDALRGALRERDYVPIVFDFERPTGRDFTETIMTLAGMCLFVIADIMKPKSVPLELQAAVPDYMIPFVLIIQEGEESFSMFWNLKTKYKWVLNPVSYDSVPSLLSKLDKLVQRALEKHNELVDEKGQQFRVTPISEL